MPTTTMQIRTRRRRGRKISRRRPRRQSRMSRRRLKSRNGGKGPWDGRYSIASRRADARAQTHQREAANTHAEEIAARAILKEVPDIMKYLAAQVEKKKEGTKKIEQAAAEGLPYAAAAAAAAAAADGDDEKTVIANVERMLPPKYRSNIMFDVKTFTLIALLILSLSAGLPLGADARVIKAKLHIPLLTEYTPEQTSRVDYINSGMMWSWLKWAWVRDPNFTGPPIDHLRDNGARTPWDQTNAMSGKLNPGNVNYVYRNSLPERRPSHLNTKPDEEIDQHGLYESQTTTTHPGEADF